MKKQIALVLVSSIAICSAASLGAAPSRADGTVSDIRTQAPLLDFAGPLQNSAIDNAFLGSTDAIDSGFAGVSIDPEEHRIDLYWRGKLPADVQLQVNNLASDITVRVHHSQYSLKEEVLAISNLEGQPDSPKVLKGYSLSPSDTGNGILLTVPHELALTQGVAAAAYFIDNGTDLPLVNVEVAPAGKLTSRTYDTWPYSGGSLIFGPTGGYCSSGVNVVSKNTSVNYVLTAQHCFHSYYVKNISESPVYNYYSNGQARQIGTWQNTPYYNNVNYDIALYRTMPTPTQPYIYTGGIASNTTTRLSSVFNPVKGQTVCTDGARSGEHCDLIVDDIYFDWSGQYDDGKTANFTNIVKAHERNGGIALASGDSGGPVYDYQNGGYAAVGIISGGLNELKSCTVTVETCYDTVFFSSIYRDLSALGMDLQK